MRVTKIKSKKFKLKKSAVEWAKKQKDKMAATDKIKWETNRTGNKSFPWEAVLFREV